MNSARPKLRVDFSSFLGKYDPDSEERGIREHPPNRYVHGSSVSDVEGATEETIEFSSIISGDVVTFQESTSDHLIHAADQQRLSSKILGKAQE